MIITEYFIFGASLLILMSVFASKATGRFGVPALLFFLIIGMLAGSEGIGKVYFDDPFLTQGLGIFALIFILFSGGLDTHWKEVKPIVYSGLLLSSIGVVITCVLTGLAASYLLNFSIWEGLLLGGIMSSTDAAAVFSILRTQKIGLKGHTKPLLELESGSNDPMSVFLTVSFIALINKEHVSSWELIPSFFQEMIVGGLVGILSGKAIKSMINWIKLEYEALYPALTIALVLITYGLTQLIGGNGFLAVYLAGVFLKKENFLHKKSLTLFHDGLAWFMQIAMFIVLGLLVFPSQLIPVAVPGLILSLFLMFIARPLAVFVSLIKSPFTLNDKIMISWVGLRGAVPIVLATFPLIAQIPKADTIFNIVFFIVLTSTLIQGTTIQLVARWLNVDAPFKQKFRFPLEYVASKDMLNDLIEIDIINGSSTITKSVVEVSMPKGSLIVLVRRRGDVFVPRGSTQIEENDTLLILAEKDSINDVYQALDVPPMTAIA
jgi:cell volume regulation protein A